ncbi:hypothetical protein CJ030_MR4G009593 [Morella rubra]|uniref:Uncharacterized protein n=1 Tax=Morella rubra TaxID=262757 RepID=A0A6A1VT46_9ROSI|nr:hypothetical protein CJ030_MR4G009593 [Morella rubra]
MVQGLPNRRPGVCDARDSPREEKGRTTLNLKEMKLFEREQVIDLDPYVVILKIRAWVSNTYAIVVEHEPYLYLKDPPLPRVKYFRLVDVPPEPIIPYPSPPAPQAESN